ncbi:lecithin retinol acyltransferase family protein [Pseudomonas putida]
MGFLTLLLDLLADAPIVTGGYPDSKRKTSSQPQPLSPLKNLSDRLASNLFLDMVEPIPGSIVYCNLGEAAEHSGIYIGRNRIVHLDGSGLVEKVSPQQFINRLNGLNPSISIYVSCKSGKAVGSKSAAAYARSMIGSKSNYSLFENNCHKFTSSCISGRNTAAVSFFYLLKQQVKKELGCSEWRVWKR